MPHITELPQAARDEHGRRATWTKSVLRPPALFAGAALALIGAAFFTGRVLAAGIPETEALRYAGTLMDVKGQPLEGEPEIQLRFWDAGSAGNVLCSKAKERVALRAGRFSLVLPDECTDAIRGNKDAWIEIIIDDVSTGRAKAGAVPYAVEAERATSAAGVLRRELDQLQGRFVPTLRAVIPIVTGPQNVTATAYTQVGPGALALRQALETVPEQIPRSKRQVRFRVTYTDDLNGSACQPNESEWRLGRHDAADTSFLDWTLAGTWSGLQLQWSNVSPFLDAAVLESDSCDSGWDNGSCRLYARIPPACAGATLRVEQVALEVYDLPD
jgi:hypothetical protein